LTNGIDCSGFVQQLFGKIGVDLPRTAAEQAKVGKKIERLEDLQPGDRLYFWDKKRGKIGHTGIFLGFFKDGGAYFIHSSTNNKGVDTDDLRSKKWLNMLVAARR
jgi:cell wall-associated NlpC family hydrolase